MVKRYKSSGYYARNGNKKRRTFKKRTYRRRYSRINRNPKRPEIKHVAISSQEQNLNTLSQFTAANYKLLNPIGYGTADYQRTGTIVCGTSVRIKGFFHNNTAGTNICRLLLFELWDNDALTELATGANMFSDNSGASPTGLRCMYWPLNFKLFKVVHADKVIKLGAGTSIDGSQVKPFSITKKIAHRLTFDSTVTTPENHQLYFMAFVAQGDDDSVGTVVEWNFLSKYYFQDV